MATLTQERDSVKKNPHATEGRGNQAIAFESQAHKIRRAVSHSEDDDRLARGDRAGGVVSRANNPIRSKARSFRGHDELDRDPVDQWRISGRVEPHGAVISSRRKPGRIDRDSECHWRDRLRLNYCQPARRRGTNLRGRGRSDDMRRGHGTCVARCGQQQIDLFGSHHSVGSHLAGSVFCGSRPITQCLN
jgi:hypothetical protein